jgi:putative transposase
MTVVGHHRCGRHMLSALHGHLVFVTSYQRGVLTGEHLRYLNAISGKLCNHLAAVPARYTGDDDHMHILAGYPAEVSAAAPVNSLNSVSARILRQRYPTHREHL